MAQDQQEVTHPTAKEDAVHLPSVPKTGLLKDVGPMSVASPLGCSAHEQLNKLKPTRLPTVCLWACGDAECEGQAETCATMLNERPR